MLLSITYLKRDKDKKAQKCAECQNGQTLYSARRYLDRLNLDEIWSFEEIAHGLGKHIDSKKVEGAVHPRRVWSMMGAYETIYRYKLGDKWVSSLEVKDAVDDLKDYFRLTQEQTDSHKRKFMMDMRSSCRHAAQRLKYLELGDRGTGKRLMKKRDEMDTKIARIDQNLKYAGMISDAFIGGFSFLVSMILTKDPMIGAATALGTGVARIGDTIAYNHANKRKDAIGEEYLPQIKALEEKIAFHRDKITIQTITEIINYMGDDIPNSVVEA